MHMRLVTAVLGGSLALSVAGCGSSGTPAAVVSPSATAPGAPGYDTVEAPTNPPGAVASPSSAPGSATAAPAPGSPSPTAAASRSPAPASSTTTPSSAVQLRVLSPAAGGRVALPAPVSYEVSGVDVSSGRWTLRVEVDLVSAHPTFDFVITSNAGSVTIGEDNMFSGVRDLVVSLVDGSGNVRASVRVARVTLEGGRAT